MTDRQTGPWWAISGASIRDMLARAHGGESPDIIYAEYFVNSGHEKVEPTIPWRDGLAEFLPPPKKVQSIIRHVIGEHQHMYDNDCGLDFGCSCDGYAAHPETSGPDDHADHLTEQIMQALTKETP